MSYKVMSCWDMCRIPEVKDILLSDDLSKIYQMLHDVGFNIDHQIDVESCYHRTIYKDVVYAPRFIGFPRIDDEWMNSGYATDEERKIGIGVKDVSLLKEIEEMSKESNFTGELCNYLSDYWGNGEITCNIEVSNS